MRKYIEIAEDTGLMNHLRNKVTTSNTWVGLNRGVAKEFHTKDEAQNYASSPQLVECLEFNREKYNQWQAKRIELFKQTKAQWEEELCIECEGVTSKQFQIIKKTIDEIDLVFDENSYTNSDPIGVCSADISSFHRLDEVAAKIVFLTNFYKQMICEIAEATKHDWSK
jgi:hypothetical protein